MLRYMLSTSLKNSHEKLNRIKSILKKIYNRVLGDPIIMSWANQVTIFLHGLLVTSIIVVKFTYAELAYWYLLQALIGFGLLADAGFAHTLARAVAFFFEGAKKIPRNRTEYDKANEKSDSPNYEMLSALLYTTKTIYILLGILTIILLATAGLAFLWNILSIENHPRDFWIAFIVMIVTTFFKLQRIKWSSFMRGTRNVAEYEKYMTILNVMRIIGFLAILLSGLGIQHLMMYLLFEALLENIIVRRFVIRWFGKRKIKIHHYYKINKDIMRSLWPVTWKSGLNTWGYFFAKQGISLIIGQLKEPVLMANYLFTERILSFIRRIGEAPIFAHFPRYYSMMAVKDYNRMKKEASPKLFLSFIIIILGFFLFKVSGNFLLDLINSDKRLIGTSIYLLMSIIIILDFNALVHGTFYISTNDVPFLIPSLLTGATTVTVGLIIIPHYGIPGLIIVQLFTNLACNFWYSTYLNLKLIKWPFLAYLNDVFIYGSKHWVIKTINFSKKIRI